MIVKSYQTAFHREGTVKIRPIYIPDHELENTAVEELEDTILSRAFYYGQNDFQPRADCYSVSVGDVIELNDGRRFRVMACGFVELKAGEDPVALVGREAHKAGYGF